MTAIILLGNRLNDDGSLSEILLHRLEILKEATDLFHPDYIILSGGIANKHTTISEAEAMLHHLNRTHFSFQNILLEKESKTTKQNAIYSLKLCNQYKIDSIILITSLDHFSRSWSNPIQLFLRELKNYSNIKFSIYSK